MDITLFESIIAIIIFAVLCMLFSQKDRLSKASFKFGDSEINVELQKIVQEEVRRTNLVRLRELAKLDQLLIDVWEREQAERQTGRQSAVF